MKPIDLLLALVVVTIWGFNFIVIKIGLQDLPPLLFTALRFLIAALPLAFFIKKPAIPFWMLCAYASFQFALQFSLLFYGLKVGFAPGLASLVMQLQAFFTIGFAIFLLGEKPSAIQLIAALIGFSALGLVAVFQTGTTSLLGFILVIAASLSWGIANIVTKRMGNVHPLALVVWGSVIASPPLLLISLIVEGWSGWVHAAHAIQLRSLGAVLYQAYANTIVGYGIWSYLIRQYHTSTVAPFSLLVPVIGMSSAAWIIDEPLQWWKVTAAILVISGLILNLVSNARAARRAIHASVG